jgi:capsular polysaccharide export protein
MNLPVSQPDRGAQRAQERRFLFLQGPIGPFFRLLAQRLRAGGCAVHRIHFNGGDSQFRSGGGAVAYRGGRRQWPAFLEQRLQQWQITDLVLFGDCRPLHRLAIDAARRQGLEVHVFEEGYLRPNWITLEAGGVNDNSSLPRDGAWYREAAQGLPQWDPGTPVIGSFPRRAAEDVLYNLLSWLCTPLFPGYSTHKPWHPFVEYRAGARRFLSRGADRQKRDRVAAELASGSRPYYLMPLQLDADSQIRFHSSFGGMAPAIEQVVESFARHAPLDSLLAVTEHPLDAGVVDQRQVTLRLAQLAGVTGRVVFMRGGSTDPLVQGARGVITVNSTLGVLALSYGVPVKTLGRALYDMPGLTFQPVLHRFWNEGAPPDAALFDCFRRVLVGRTQINGGLYCRAGLLLAADNAAQRLIGTPAGAAVRPRPDAPAGAPTPATLSMDAPMLLTAAE